jgi:hypothetical protein
VVTGFRWDAESAALVVGLDQRKVVRTHLAKTNSVLIEERSLNNRIDTGAQTDTIGYRSIRWLISVVTPLALNFSVARCEEESLDSMRKADVVVQDFVVNGSARSRLNLLNADVARSGAHLDTFSIGNDGVVGPDLDILKVRSLSAFKPSSAISNSFQLRNWNRIFISL